MKRDWLAMAATAAMIGAPALAQNSQTHERQFTGRLDSKSPQDDDHPYQVRTMSLEAGTRYAISAESEDFDPALRLSFADDNDEAIAEDDDGGDGNNAYIEFAPARSGTYRLRVSSVDDSKGGYLLKVRDLPPLPAPLRPQPVGNGTILLKHYSGALTQTDAEIRGRRVDDYAFRFEGGKRVLIFMDHETEGLDPLLQVYSADNRLAKEPIASDDDHGGGLNALVSFTPEESGDYIVRATSAGDEGGTGIYKLRIGQEP